MERPPRTRLPLRGGGGASPLSPVGLAAARLSCLSGPPFSFALSIVDSGAFFLKLRTFQAPSCLRQGLGSVAPSYPQNQPSARGGGESN